MDGCDMNTNAAIHGGDKNMNAAIHGGDRNEDDTFFNTTTPRAAAVP